MSANKSFFLVKIVVVGLVIISAMVAFNFLRAGNLTAGISNDLSKLVSPPKFHRKPVDKETETLKAGVEHMREKQNHLSDSNDFPLQALQSDNSGLKGKRDEDLGVLAARVDPEITASDPNETIERSEEERIIAEANAKIETMERTLQNHDIDPEWSMSATDSVYEVFSAAELKGVRLENADCRSTLCRVQLYYDGSTSVDESYRRIVDSVPWPAQGFVQIDEESGSVEFYFAREGHELPAVSDQNIH